MAKQTSTELTVQETRQLLLNPAYQAVKQFEIQQRMANMYVSSTIVPDNYRGNIGNCVIAIDMAMRMQLNPLMVMQNLYIVHGNPAWSSKFLISCINMSGRFTPLRYQFVGKRGTAQYGCRAYAYEASDKEHKEALCGVWITIDMANKEGWTAKNGSKWITMPDQMLIYRAAAFWARAYAPEISMGFQTKEEIEDAVLVDETPVPVPSATDDIPEPPITDAPTEEPSASAEQPSAPVEQPSSRSAQTAAELHEQWKAQKAADVIGEAIQRQSKKTAYRAPSSTDVIDEQTGEIYTNEQQ